MADTASVVLGAAITLVGTVIVQTVVMPWTAARTRHRERWEHDLNRLSDLLDETLGDAWLEMNICGLDAISRRMLIDQYPDGKDAAQSSQEKWELANEKVEDLIIRVSMLVDRLCRVHKNAPEWADIQDLTKELGLAHVYLTGAVSLSIELHEWEDRTEAVNKERKALIAAIAPIVGSMRPPRRRWARHVVAGLRRKFRRELAT